MIRADFTSEELERFDVVNQSVEVEILEIGARQRRAARGIGPVGATRGLCPREIFPVEAAHVIRKKSTAVKGTDFQIGKAIEHAAVNQNAERQGRVGGITA